MNEINIPIQATECQDSSLPSCIRFGPYTAEVLDGMKLNDNELGRIEWEVSGPWISLTAGLTPRIARMVLIHEALHLADDAANLGLGEKGVSKLEFAICELLDKNPDLFSPLPPA
jgi:hypothetical protein